MLSSPALRAADRRLAPRAPALPQEAAPAQVEKHLAIRPNAPQGSKRRHAPPQGLGSITSSPESSGRRVD
jgi:hypothetical protein